jgi:hypothetical protein
MLIFPDVEVVLVSYFKTALAALATPLSTGVRVATVKAQQDQSQPAKEIIINVSYNEEVEYVTRVASVTLEVYANSYGIASQLGLLTEALARECVGGVIKKAEVRLGPVRTSESSEQERRSLDIELVIKGSTV